MVNAKNAVDSSLTLWWRSNLLSIYTIMDWNIDSGVNVKNAADSSLALLYNFIDN